MPRPISGACRGQQAEKDTGQSRMDARLEEGEPEPRPHDGVDHHAAHPEPSQEEDETKPDAGEGERAEGDLIAVHDRDDQHRADIVGDSQGQEEGLQPVGSTRTEEGQEATDEGDVGGHRHAPAIPSRPTPEDKRVKGRGKQHPPDGGQDRQEGLPRLG